MSIGDMWVNILSCLQGVQVATPEFQAISGYENFKDLEGQKKRENLWQEDDRDLKSRVKSHRK